MIIRIHNLLFFGLILVCLPATGQVFNRALVADCVTINETSVDVLIGLQIEDFGSIEEPLNLGTEVQLEINGEPSGTMLLAAVVSGGGGGTKCDDSCADTGCADLGDENNTFQCKSYLFNCYCGSKQNAVFNDLSISTNDLVAIRIAPAPGALPEVDTIDDDVSVVASVVEGQIFTDGFETGDTSRWSNVVPFTLNSSGKHTRRCTASRVTSC